MSVWWFVLLFSPAVTVLVVGLASVFVDIWADRKACEDD